MVRAVLGLLSIVVAVAVILLCFGYSAPQLSDVIPGVNHAAQHAASLMSRTTAFDEGSSRDSSSLGARNNSAPASTPPPPAQPSSAPGPETGSPAGASGQAPEIISPATTAHLNSEHIREVEQPVPAWQAAGRVNPSGFVPPNPLPAHPHWTWEVLNREFTNVVVTHVDADTVTITSDSGPAQIEIALLPTDVQRELNYNPTFAAQAAAARKSAP